LKKCVKTRIPIFLKEKRKQNQPQTYTQITFESIRKINKLEVFLKRKKHTTLVLTLDNLCLFNP
jgi:hypothetical protein